MNQSEPTVSVIIATRNRARLLPCAIKSALAAGTRVEIVVVDDASTDDSATARVCRSFNEVRYLRLDRHQGLGGARNVGIVASRAEFISFLDDDDERLPGSLDEQVDALRAAPEAGFVYGQALLADERGELTGDWYPKVCPRGDIFWELLENNFIPCPAPVFRRACLRRIGMPTNAIPGVEDWDLWLRIAELYPVVAIERPVASYRDALPGSGQISSSTANMVTQIARGHRRYWTKLPRFAEATDERRRRVTARFQNNMTDVLLFRAGFALTGGHPSHAARNALAAMRLFPARLAHKTLDTSGLRQFAGGALTGRRQRQESSKDYRREQAGNEL